jgi:uncharacterized protein YciI
VLFVIHALDGADGAEKRKLHNPLHQAHLDQAAAQGVTIVMSGPLQSADQTTLIGSHFVLEVADRATLDRFHQKDPFYQAGVWSNVSIAPFKKTRG